MSRPLILGTRGSELALAQTRLVMEALRGAHPDLAVVHRVITTSGDRDAEAPPGRSATGWFTQELEEALLAGDIGAAVHSLKDLPTSPAAGLMLGAVLPRADTADVLVSRTPGGLEGLPRRARVGTGSPRRQAQLLLARPDAEPAGIRGNVPTRLRKLASGADYDAVILAAAGLARLGRPIEGTAAQDGVTLHFSRLEHFLPAPGQGAIAVEVRADDAATAEVLAPVGHDETAVCVAAERALLAALGGGCHLPLGARAEIRDGRLTLRAVVFDAVGGRPKYGEMEGGAGDAEALARSLAIQWHVIKG